MENELILWHITLKHIFSIWSCWKQNRSLISNTPNKKNLFLNNQVYTLTEKCSNTELFLVRVFLHTEWIRRDTKYSDQKIRTRNNSVFGHFSCSDTQWKPTPGGRPQNSSSVSVFKTIRKWNACEEENFYFKDFLVTGSQYLYSRLFHNSNFLLQLLPTAWEYSMFLPLTKIKSHKIKGISDEKCA